MRPCDSGLGDALHAVRAALPLEDTVRTVALDGERHFLVAAAVARARAELLDLEALPLGIAREHPVHVARPERGLVAADALPDLEDHVLVIGRVARDHRKPQLVLEPRRALLELGDELLQIGVAARGVEVGTRGAQLLHELVGAFEVLDAAADLGRLTVVVVDGRLGHARLRFRVGALELVDAGVERVGHDRPQSTPGCYAASVATSVISGTPASAFDTGQFAFAPCAASSNAGRVDPREHGPRR